MEEILLMDNEELTNHINELSDELEKALQEAENRGLEVENDFFKS